MMNKMAHEASVDAASSSDDTQSGDTQSGQSVCINCNADGTYDVYAQPLQPASEKEYPDGIFGLDSLEEALKAVIAVKQNGPDMQSQQDDEMMREFAGDGSGADQAGQSSSGT